MRTGANFSPTTKKNSFWKRFKAKLVHTRFFDAIGYFRELMPEDSLRSHEAAQATIMEILEKHFPNGIRPNSIIDANKLKNHFLEATGKNILAVISDISSVLEAIGIRHGDKLYAVSASRKQKLAELLEQLLSKDNRLFYYDELYDAHMDFFQNMCIFSSEQLRTILLKIIPSLWYDTSYCMTNRTITVKSEILRCYETNVSLSYDQLKEKLHYIPITSIRQVLAQNGDFIWVRTGIYTHISKIEFDRAECFETCAKIKNRIADHGFVTLASIYMQASAELNPELSEIAIKNGLFQMYLADHYEKRGNIVTLKGTALNSVAVFEDFCRSHASLTLKELLDYEKEINGSVHSQSLFVAYDNMIRINRETFVADSEIQFDIEATDDALARFVHSEVIPLRAVTTFTSFPYIDGYPWNWFLLESYCRRFSKQFKYQCLSVNSRNVGAIFKKSAIFQDYIDVMSAAVAMSSVELNEKTVGGFLFENKYVAQRTVAVRKVTERARLLRERRT
jgi:hypothetical protein